MSQTFTIQVSEDALENKNAALGAIIRQAAAVVKNSDIPGDLKPFGDETPMNTVEIRELFNMERGNFNFHFTTFKKFTKEHYDKEIQPLMDNHSGPDIYPKQVVREFLAYMNRDKIKYEIIL